MSPPEIIPLDYAKPELDGAERMKEGISNGRAAMLLLILGIPLSIIGIGWACFPASMYFAVVGTVQSRGRSVCGWLVIAGFSWVILVIVHSLLTG